MDETSNSLLAELRSNGSGHAWQQLLACYTPFLTAIFLRKQIPPDDVDDLIQNVLTVVVRRLPEFDRQRTGSFRTWLRAICANCLREHWRHRGRRPTATGDSQFHALLEALDDPASDLSRFWEQQHDQYVLRHLLESVRDEFRATTYEAFRRLAVENEPVDDVARDLGITVNAAFVARSRVLKRLRQRGEDLTDEP